MGGETQRLEEIAYRMPPAQWLVDMHDHYAKTRQYRPRDLERILGDQTKGVSMDAREASALLCRHTR